MRKRSIRRWIVLGMLGTVAACKSAETASDGKAIYSDPRFTGEQSRTWQRLATLSRFANDLLGKEEVQWRADGTAVKTGRVEPLHAQAVRDLTQNGVNAEAVLPLNRPGNPEAGRRGNYLMFIEQESKECFFEEGFFDKKIDSDTQRDAIITQLRNMARFLKEFHVLIDGDVDQGFVPSRIELCTKSYWNDRSVEMEWRGNGHLRINIPASKYGWGSTYSPYSSDKLLAMWNSGAMFTGTTQADEVIRKAWPFFNPASDKRKELVKFMRRAALRLLPKLAKLVVDNGRGWPAGARLAAGDRVNPQDLALLVRAEVDGARLAYAPDKALAKLEEIGRTGEFVRLWREFVANPANQDAIINAAPLAVSENRSVKVTNVAISLIASVSNVHDISAKVSVAAGRFAKYIRVHQPTENRTEISQYCISLIASVCTVDKVEAFVDVILRLADTDQALATAGFDEAVSRTLGRDWVPGRGN